MLSTLHPRPVASPGSGLRYQAERRRGALARHAGLGPLPLPLSRTRQARTPAPVWPLACGAFPSKYALGREREVRAPVIWPGEKWGRCWTGRGHRTTSRCRGFVVPSEERGGGGGARGASPCPREPQRLEVEFPPGVGVRQSKGVTMVSPRTTRPNSLFSLLPSAASCL